MVAAPSCSTHGSWKTRLIAAAGTRTCVDWCSRRQSLVARFRYEPGKKAMAVVVACGVGDVGSAVALALFRDGQNVVLHDRPKAAHARRGAAFTDALYEGKVQLEGVYAKYPHSIASLQHMLRCRRALAISDHAFDGLLSASVPAYCPRRGRGPTVQPSLKDSQRHAPRPSITR